ncbi:MAG: WD40 repeat domain-containing protein [Bacteroidales bacterium]|nr:WD40 repeat domain-containing protein [Bacteroidales bacterium]MDP2234897.1 WD40 repeat domain-containing protein [Bacteroidales bacterium]
MKNNLIAFLLIISANCWAQNNDLYIKKFTNINPVSYTDVIYIGIKDTVLVSTYSGRISKIINGENKENILTKIDDEIFALAYNKSKKEIIASTLSNGILILNERNGKIIKKLSLPSSWANTVVCSETFNYLATQDQKGKRYIFDIQNNYTNIGSDSLIPTGRIIKIDKDNIATIVSSKKVILWNLSEKIKVNEWTVELVRFADMDYNGEFLSIDFNECMKYDANNKTIAFKIIHPNWPLANPENDTEIFDIPLQLQLNAAKFAKNYIYTGSIDRTVRVWDKFTGKLITTLTGHKGSISKIKVTSDETQVVSVDLKGVIKFWDVK